MKLPHLAGLRLPPLRLVRQRFPADGITDLAGTTKAALERLRPQLIPGLRVALAVGSRGIAELPVMVATTVAWLRASGCEVFIVPAMGSHGGATAGGQAAVLARLGITEATVGCPIRSDMSTRRLGGLRWTGSDYVDVGAQAASDLELHGDAIALDQADLVLPIVRIKPHTGFRGAYESGICKMLAIGFGKHETCSRLHREGYERFARLIPAAGRALIASGSFLGALAVVENESDHPVHVEAVPAAAIMDREPHLLDLAKRRMPRLPFDRVDVLVVERIGKDISGTGMDPNITGRSELGPVEGFTGPAIGRIVVLGLTEAAKGNATGIGMADVITEACFQAIDREATAVNVLTSGSLRGGRLPVAVPGDDQAILAAAACVPGVRAEDARIVRIPSTLRLERLAISPALATGTGLEDLGPFTGTWP